MAALWRELLHVDVVEATDNFFDLGGHSLLAAQLCSRLRADHDLHVSVVDVFHHPTIRLLAASVHTGSSRLAAAAHRSSAPLTEEAEIAVVGLACRFPGAPDANAF
jgi:hypothetical protein